MCTGSRLCLFWRDASARIARIFSVAQWPNGKQVSCPALQVIQRVKKREMFTHQALLLKMWILAILQHPQLHYQFKCQRLRRLRLREENRRLKQQLEQVLSLQPDRHSEHDDDDVQDGDGRYKDWSQLGTLQKRKLVCDIETKLKLLADKKDTGIVNIAASIISRFSTILLEL